MSLLKEAMLVAQAHLKRSASYRAVTSSQQLVVTITCDHISGFAEMLQLCLKKWINQITRAEDITVRGRFYYVQEARLKLIVLNLW